MDVGRRGGRDRIVIGDLLELSGGRVQGLRLRQRTIMSLFYSLYLPDLIRPKSQLTKHASDGPL